MARAILPRIPASSAVSGGLYHPHISAWQDGIPEPADRDDGNMKIDEIIENFELLEDWDDRYRYLIELGRDLPPLAETDRTEANKVRGCASQVWLATKVKRGEAGEPRLYFEGDSDAHIVRGLIAILFALYSGQPAQEILSKDAGEVFEQLGLREHLTPQRSNGFRSMVERMRADSRAALAQVA